jgi:hypothetical protein
MRSPTNPLHSRFPQSLTQFPAPSSGDLSIGRGLSFVNSRSVVGMLSWRRIGSSEFA